MIQAFYRKTCVAPDSLVLTVTHMEVSMNPGTATYEQLLQCAAGWMLRLCTTSCMCTCIWTKAFQKQLEAYLDLQIDCPGWSPIHKILRGRLLKQEKKLPKTSNDMRFGPVLRLMPCSSQMLGYLQTAQEPGLEKLVPAPVLITV